eukprot:UN0605
MLQHALPGITVKSCTANPLLPKLPPADTRMNNVTWGLLAPAQNNTMPVTNTSIVNFADLLFTRRSQRRTAMVLDRLCTMRAATRTTQARPARFPFLEACADSLSSATRAARAH